MVHVPERFATGAATLWILTLLVGGLALVVSFSRGFDLSDEGLVLQLLQQGRDGRFVSFFHVLFHPIGVVFGHWLVGYRLLDLALVVASVAVVVHAIVTTTGPFPAWEGGRRREALLTFLVAGLTWLAWAGRYWWLYPTLTYSNLPGPLALMSLSALLWVVNGARVRQREAGAAALALVALVAFACRAPSGAVLWVVQLGLIVVGGGIVAGLERRLLLRLATVYVAASVLVFLPFLVAIAPELRRVVESVAPALRSTTHKSLLLVGMGDVRRLGATTLLACGWVAAMGFVARRWLVLLLAGLGCAGGLMLGLTWGPVIVMTGVAAGGGVVAAVTRSGKDRVSSLFWGGAVGLVALACAIGSSSYVFATATHLIPVMGAYCALLAVRLPDGRRSMTLLCVLICVGIGWGCWSIAAKRFRRPYRSASFSELTAVSRLSPVLYGVGLGPADAANIDALIDSLEARGFERTRDRLIAFPDLPGLVGACGARAFGCAWVCTGYENVDSYNVACMETEPTEDIRHVYFVLGDRLTPALSTFAARRFRPLPETRVERIGQMAWHVRDQFWYGLTLAGPYVVEGAPRPAP